MSRFRQLVFILLAVASFGIPSASAGGLLISIGDLQQSGSSGSFEVLLSNTELAGGTTFSIAGFSFGMSVDPSSGIAFTAVDFPSSGTYPYIFAGATLGVPLSFDLTSTDFTASDVYFPPVPPVDPLDPIVFDVTPGATYSLALVSFTADTTVSLATLQTLFVPDLTTIAGSDDPDDNIPVSFPSTNAVPEPSSLVMLSLAGALGLGLRFRPRRNLI